MQATARITNQAKRSQNEYGSTIAKDFVKPSKPRKAKITAITNVTTLGGVSFIFRLLGYKA